MNRPAKDLALSLVEQSWLTTHGREPPSVVVRRRHLQYKLSALYSLHCWALGDHASSCKGADTLVSWPRVGPLLASYNVEGLQCFVYCGLRTHLVGKRLCRLLLCLGEAPALGKATRMTQLRFSPAAMHPNHRIADQGNASIRRWLIFTLGWADSPYWSLYYILVWLIAPLFEKK